MTWNNWSRKSNSISTPASVAKTSIYASSPMQRKIWRVLYSPSIVITHVFILYCLLTGILDNLPNFRVTQKNTFSALVESFTTHWILERDQHEMKLNLEILSKDVQKRHFLLFYPAIWKTLVSDHNSVQILIKPNHLFHSPKW